MRLFAALLSLVLLAAAPAVPAAAQERLRGERPVPADRLPRRHRAAGHDHHHQSADAQLRAAARAVRAVGRRRAAGLDRDAAGRRPAGRRGDGGHQRQHHRCNCASTCRPNAAMGTQNLTVTAKGASHRVDPADRGHARQGSAGQAHARARSCRRCAAPRSRASSISSTIKNDSGRNLVGRAARRRRRRTSRRASPSSTAARSYQLDPGRGRPVQGHQAQGARRRARSAPAAIRCSVKVVRRGRHRRRHASPLEITGQPRLSLSGRDGVLSARAEVGKEAVDPDRRHQHRHGAGRRDRALRQRAERLEGRVRAEDHRPHRAGREQGSAGAGDAAGEGDRRRLRRRRSAPSARGETATPTSASRSTTSTAVGHRRHRHHRDRAADHGGRGCAVRPPMNDDNVIEARGLTKRYGATRPSTASLRQSRAARSSACSGPTARARPRPS